MNGTASPTSPPLKVATESPNPTWEELGFSDVPGPELMHLSRILYSMLELRIGATLASQMTEDQLRDFEQFTIDNPPSQADALNWLKANLPDHKIVVRRAYGDLIAELRSSAPEIRQTLNEHFRG